MTNIKYKGCGYHFENEKLDKIFDYLDSEQIIDELGRNYSYQKDLHGFLLAVSFLKELEIAEEDSIDSEYSKF